MVVLFARRGLGFLVLLAVVILVIRGVLQG